MGARMKIPGGSALLTVQEMARADQLAIAAGIPGIDLMEAAGRGVARCIQRRHAAVPVVVLCGPGMNGGDGFVVARLLAEAGWTVRLGLLGSIDRLQGDAALAAARWDGLVEAASPVLLDGAGMVVDALFGAGLNRDLSGAALKIVEAVRDQALAGRFTVVAIDVPSGVDGDTGRVRGAAAPADFTVTFFREKPGHLLLPGRELMGDPRVIDIGIPTSVIDDIGPRQGRNSPEIWRALLPIPGPTSHKYRRGHAVIAAGAVMTGAARLAAMAARRVGAGLLTLAAPNEVADLYRAAAPGFLVADCKTSEDFEAVIEDLRRNAILVGPGQGLDQRTRDNAEAALATGRAVVLDADALTLFAGALDDLADRVVGPLVITPHDAEFARLFPGLVTLGKIERAREAAARLGGVVVLKGADTVIAEPGGLALINDNAPPWLATGGTGDVLAGTVLGLLAQGMAGFEAAAAAVWLNGAAATSVGAGLIAEDLPPYLARHLGATATPG
jgi:ADP-dependent NAD(P)H-hydrate dehydratase / NAD(P)H-hydrate epimerase